MLDLTRATVRASLPHLVGRAVYFVLNNGGEKFTPVGGTIRTVNYSVREVTGGVIDLNTNDPLLGTGSAVVSYECPETGKPVEVARAIIELYDTEDEATVAALEAANKALQQALEDLRDQ